MRKLTIIFAILISSLPLAAADNPEEFLGLQFPRLETDRAAWIMASDTVYGTPFPIDVMVRLFISAEGRVDSVVYDTDIKPDFVRGVKKSLTALQFKPAKIMDRETSLVLPLRVTFSSFGNVRQAALTLPYDAVTGNRDRVLIDMTLTENGFTLPGLDYFPSYYLKIPRDSGRAVYDYAVFRVHVDGEGRVIDLNIHSASNEKILDIFSITVRYARFRGASYKDMSFPAEFYLIARFFDGIRYPTAAWPADSLAASDLLSIDRYRLETLLYLDSLLGPAYPENLSGTFSFAEMSVEKDSIPAQVNITAGGKIEWAVYEKQLSVKTRDNLSLMLKEAKFIPAIDSSGQAVPYRGQLMITRVTGSNKIRITANWTH